MKHALTIIQVIVSALLIIVIIAQDKGVGLSATFGGGGEFYRSKRGIDRIMYIMTVVLSLLFIGLSVAFIFVK